MKVEIELNPFGYFAFIYIAKINGLNLFYKYWEDVSIKPLLKRKFALGHSKVTHKNRILNLLKLQILVTIPTF
jgi:hypothetical protein